MTAFWFIVACVAFVIIAGSFRRRPGSALTDVTVLVMLFALIAIADMLLSNFFETGRTGWTIAAILAFGFALDALYGLMAPDRQLHRNRRLRNLMRRRRA
jgi:hypothetical protein